MHVTDEQAHQKKLQRGLAALGPNFVARLCYWCDGLTVHTRHGYESCSVCMQQGYGTSVGLLIECKPAPDSVVNQVLVAAERAS